MLVSFITPTYNVDRFIEESAHAIIGQTYDQWEWIVVDDGSTDNTIKILEKFNDERIKIIRHEHVANLSILRNVGIRASSGHFLAFIDGDDPPHKEKLAKQVDFFSKNPKAVWCHTNVVCFMNETGEAKPRLMAKPPVSRNSDPEDALRKLVTTNFVYISSVMVRRSIVELEGFWFDERYAFCEDINLWLRLCVAGYYPYYLEQPLLTYRISSVNLSSTRRFNYLATNILILDEFVALNSVLCSRFKSEIKEGYALKYYRLAHYCWMNGDKEKMRIYLWRSLKAKFINGLAMKLILRSLWEK